MIHVERATPEESGRIRFWIAAIVGLSALSLWVSPSSLLAEIFPDLFTYESSCIMLNLTGIPCPFCGMSRALGEFTSLNFAKSTYYNPSSVPFFILCTAAVLAVAFLSSINYRFSVSDKRKTFYVVIAVVIVMWGLNILYGHHT